MLRASGIAFAYDGRAVLSDVALRARAGTLVGVVGPNGGGKSTLLHCLYGGLRPVRGTVEVRGEDVLALPPRAVARRIAVVPQASLPSFPFTVREIVAMGRYAHGRAAEGERAVDRAIARVGLGAIAHRTIHAVSGGELRKAVIAQALAQEAPLLLADEPLASLDLRHQLEVMELLRELAAPGRAVVAVLHDLSFAARFCDELVLLDRGRVAAAGEPAAVLTPERLRAVYAVEADVRPCARTAGLAIVPLAAAPRADAVEAAAEPRARRPAPAISRRALLGGLAVTLAAGFAGLHARSAASAPPGAAPSAIPRRIVALGHSGVYETLLDLDAYDRIVAVPWRCEVPGSEAKVRLRTADGGLPNIEAVLALDPDLVIVHQAALPAIARLGLRVVGVPSEGGFEALERFVQRLGDALGAPGRARELVERMRAESASIARAVEGLAPVRVYYEHGGTYETYGRGSFGDELLTLCGGANVAGSLDAPRPKVNAELVVAADPEVIVLGAFSDPPDVAARRPGWSRITAVREGRMIQLAPDDRLLWSTRYPERARRLLLPLMHPSAAAR